ncbi:MAG: hypothetical protein MH204_11495, partial [Fimbriimonadaceae bacterium]|nr:hypothetical protein [Fimbriimonadaceae bacterium]
RLGAAAKRRVAEKMASLTGLSAEFILRNDLRVEIMAFCRELLRSEGRSVGRLDGRIRGFEPEGKGTAERPEFDPSLNMLMGPYVAVYKEHMAGLGWQTDLPYRIFDGITKPWEFGRARDGYPDTSQALRRALARNPYTKVLLCSGLYDLATPFAAAEYTLSHMHLPAELAGNITIREYPAGHMMYIEEGSLSSLKADVVAWANEG